jgi:hypothetical protein
MGFLLVIFEGMKIGDSLKIFFGIQATTGGFNPSKNILSARPLSNWDPSHGWVEICRQFSDTPRFETTKQF